MNEPEPVSGMVLVYVVAAAVTFVVIVLFLVTR